MYSEAYLEFCRSSISQYSIHFTVRVLSYLLSAEKFYVNRGSSNRKYIITTTYIDTTVDGKWTRQIYMQNKVPSQNMCMC